MSLFGGKRTRSRRGQFNAPQVFAAQALAEGKTAAAAAEAAGVTARTIENWKTDKAFQDLVDSYVQDVVAKARLNLDDATVTRKRNRLMMAQKIFDAVLQRLDEELDIKDQVQLSKLGLDTISTVSKELGQEGKPLEGTSDETGLPVVNLGIKPGGVIEAYAVE